MASQALSTTLLISVALSTSAALANQHQPTKYETQGLFAKARNDAAPYEALYRAVHVGSPEKVRARLGRLNVNIGYMDGWTILMEAATNGNLPIVKILLQHGANPANEDSWGSTAFALAVVNHHYSLASYLLEHGSKIDEGYEPAITYVTDRSDLQAVQYLLTKFADVNVRDRVMDSTALINAIERKNLRIVQLLLNAGADATLATKNGVKRRYEQR